MKNWNIVFVFVICLLLIACGAAPTDVANSGGNQADNANAAPTSVDSLDPVPTDISEPEPVYLTQASISYFPNAKSIDFALAADEQVFVAYRYDHNVFVHQSNDDGATFGEAVVASLDGKVFVHPLERPAIVVDSGGRIHVGWSAEAEVGALMMYAVSDDGGATYGPSLPISQPGRETTLIRFMLGEADSPYAFFLQSAQLMSTRVTPAGKLISDQVIDDQTCDCCHPAAVLSNGALQLAYRNKVVDDQGRESRDIYMVTSLDGGATYSEPVQVSDARWFISACPFSGPSLVADEAGTLYVTWMDGRNDVEGDFSQTDIWFATSTDGGQTFSTDLRINQVPHVYNNLPSLAQDASGRLHLIWQSAEPGRDVLYYTYSDDNGQSFAQPMVLVNSQGDVSQRPSNASLHVSPEGVVYVSWVVQSGGVFASWVAVK